MATSCESPAKDQEKRAAILFVDEPMPTRFYDLSFADGLDCASLLLVEAQQAEDPGAWTYDRAYEAPFMDREALLEIQQQISGDFKVLAVLGFTEASVYPAALLAEFFGVEGIGSTRALTCRDKLMMARALAGLAQPQIRVTYRGDENLLQKVIEIGGFPVVCKPLMGFAGSGVILAANEEGLRRALKSITRLSKLVMRRFYDTDEKLGKVLLQSFLAGEEVSVDGFVEGGKVSIVAIADKPDVSRGPVFPDHIYLMPSQVAGNVKNRLEDLTRQAIAALGLDNSVFHLEARMMDGEPHIIEVAARIGCGELIKRAFGLDLCEIELALKLGRKVDARPRRQRFAGEVCINADRAGIFRGIANDQTLLQDQRITSMPIYARPGQRVAPLPNSNSYIGFIMVEAQSYDDAKAALVWAAATLEVDID
jgi:biotin carboxylase